MPTIRPEQIPFQKHRKRFIVVGILVIAVGIFVAVYFLQKEKRVEKPTIIESTEKSLPTKFRSPSLNEESHIVDATIEKLKIPGCEAECDVDIITAWEKMPDETIIAINEQFLSSLLQPSENGSIRDVRDSKTSIRLAEDTEYIDSFTNKIMFVDKGIIEYYQQAEAYYKGAAHPSRNPGSYSYFTISDQKVDEYDAVPIFSSHEASSAVLEHFYPNGKQLLESYIQSDNSGFLSECYAPDDFPENFDSELWLHTGDVVFENWFPYAALGPCAGNLLIAIPITDILSETPQYVPENSVLWRFKE